LFSVFLADRILMVALMLQYFVCLSSVSYVLWLNGASYRTKLHFGSICYVVLREIDWRLVPKWM